MLFGNAIEVEGFTLPATIRLPYFVPAIQGYEETGRVMGMEL